MERLVKLEVLGQEYPLRTDASEEDVQEVLNLVRSQVEVYSRGANKSLPLDKIAILASVNLAGEYIKLKKDTDRYKRTVEEWVQRVSKKVEQAL